MSTEHVAVVRRVKDDRVVSVRSLDGLDDPPDLAVDIAVAAKKAGLRDRKGQPLRVIVRCPVDMLKGRLARQRRVIVAPLGMSSAENCSQYSGGVT